MKDMFKKEGEDLFFHPPGMVVKVGKKPVKEPENQQLTLIA